MRNTKRSLALFLALVLTVVMLFPLAGVSATSPTVFTALGDSTGFGLSAFTTPFRDPNAVNGFNDQFAESLGLVKGTDYFNVAWPGDRTFELLSKLQQPEIKTLVKQSSIMTVTIGGNNLLGPTINSICALWDVAPIAGDLTGQQMLEELAAKVALRLQQYPDYNPAAEFMRLMDPEDAVAQQFHLALLNGVKDFAREWPLIARKIRSLNKYSELYVNTVHNPMRATSAADPLYPLYLEFEALIGAINMNIKAYARIYRYRVVDLNQAFKLNPASLSFDIPGALQSATALAYSPSPELALLFMQQTDPHPTLIGHGVAYMLLTQVRSSTPEWYWTR